MIKRLLRLIFKRKQKKPVGIEEGDICNREECTGILRYEREGECFCHTNPPCWACFNAALTCPSCGWTEKD